MTFFKPWLTVHSSAVTCQLIRALAIIRFICWPLAIGLKKCSAVHEHMTCIVELV